MISTQQVDRPRAVDGEVIPAFQYGALDADTARKARDAVAFINARQRSATTAILEIGECLVGVKDALGHGNFIAWLEAEFGWTDRTARNYMMAAKALPKTEIVSVLPVTAMYDLARSPEPIRERIIGELEKGELRADAVRERISEARREAEAERQEAKKSPAERKREQARPADKGANLHLLDEPQPAPVSVAQAAELLNVSERSVKSARKVHEQGTPELVAAVDTGKVSVSAAADIATKPKEEQAVIVARGEKVIAAAIDIIRGTALRP